MLIKKLVLLTLIMSSLTLMVFAADSEMVQAMAQLDKVYIPALGLTGQAGDSPRTVQAMTKFKAVWEDFQDHWKDAPGMDERWKTDLAEITLMTKEAATQMEAHQATKAHEALEGVRGTLLNARQRHQIVYYLDKLTLFHSAMEELLGLTADTELSAYRNEWEKSAGLWQATHPELGLIDNFQLTSPAQTQLNQQWSELNTLFQNGMIELTSGKKPSNASIAKIKPLFTKTFFLFGDFPK